MDCVGEWTLELLREAEWLACERLLAVRNQVFRNGLDGIWRKTGGVGEGEPESIASSGNVPSHPQIPAYRMEPIAGTEHVEGFRCFSLGAGDIVMAEAFKIMKDHGLLAMRGLCAARRVSPSIRFATQFGTRGIMPGDGGLQDREEEDVFLDGLPPLSSRTSQASKTASTPREHAQYGYGSRGDRIGEADDPGPEMED